MLSVAAIGGGLWLYDLSVLSYISIAAGAGTHENILLELAVRRSFLNVELRSEIVSK
ncbi:MAG TPA: hypothetical protein VLZ74_12745 [Methylocella sp.]|nr:hypothetical protein [Methylocella sp.]